MLSPSNTYKMSKQNKRFLATITDRHARGAVKRSLIEAQLQSQVQIRSSKNKDRSE